MDISLGYSIIYVEKSKEKQIVANAVECLKDYFIITGGETLEWNQEHFIRNCNNFDWRIFYYK